MGAVSRIHTLARRRAGFLALAAGLCAFAIAPPLVAEQAVNAPLAPPVGPSSSRIVATSLDVAASGELTRVSFKLSGATSADAFSMANPDRIIVDLPEVEFRIDPMAGRPAPPAHERASARPGRAQKIPAANAASAGLAGAARSVRFGLFSEGKSRIVIDLAEPVRIVRAATEKGADGGWSLIVDLARTDRQSFLAAARRPDAAPRTSAAALAPQQVPEHAPVVVIDAGHGGVDEGARSNSGTLEKDIALEFARLLAARLETSGRYTPVLTRSTDVFIPLNDRVRIAREAGAALFVSIHADKLGDDPQVAGATIYTVSDKASDAQAARLAEKENQSDAAAGLQGRQADDEVAGILFDLTRRETRAYSHVFARTLVGYLGEVALLNKNAQRSAGFRVLKAPDVPSVLLELGYLSNDKDAPNLASGEWRGRVAGAVAKAIDRFFASRNASEGVAGPASQENRLQDSFKAVAAATSAGPR